MKKDRQLSPEEWKICVCFIQPTTVKVFNSGILQADKWAPYVRHADTVFSVYLVLLLANMYFMSLNCFK